MSAHLLDYLHVMPAYLLVTPIKGTLAQAFMPSYVVQLLTMNSNGHACATSHQGHACPCIPAN